MRISARSLVLVSAVVVAVGLSARQAHAQAFGLELHNTLMPASGGMAGTSIARPQDVTSAINGNPATLTQFHGTNFTVGGAWNESTFNIQHSGGALPNLGSFSAKSQAQGVVPGNIGVSQDFSALGFPVTVGMGLFAVAGAGVDVAGVPQSNGTSLFGSFLHITSGAGVDLTERLSAGASISLGTGTFDGLFVGSSRAVYDYALRGSMGLDYDLGCSTTLGAYYQTKQSYTFNDAISLDLGGGAFGPSLDIALDMPDNIGFGIANEGLMDGNLLLAVDVLYKQWENADLFRALYRNQWVVQVGSQYTRGRKKFRLGYAYAENPIDPNPGTSAGGITPPGGRPALEYAQALVGNVGEHRLSGGVGMHDILPGVDIDLLGGGQFEASHQYGQFTSNSLASYWVGAGLTWRFSRGSCQRMSVANEWGCDTHCQ